MKKVSLLLFIVAGFFASCTKQNGNIILPGQSSNEGIDLHITDTLSFKCRTISEDSLAGNGLSYALIGQLNDYPFGKSTANFYSNICLIESFENFPNGDEPDSAVLFIPCVEGLNTYGNPMASHHLKISQLTSAINSANAYYQKDEFTSDPTTTTHYYGKIINKYFDSIQYRKTKLAPYNGLKVKLSTETARKLMHMPKEAYTTNEKLSNYFKGISIEPVDQDFETGNGSFGVFDINNYISTAYRAKIILYFHDTNALIFGFTGNGTTAITGKTGPYHQEIQQQLHESDNTHFQYTYVQALSGVKTKISFPYLFNLAPKNNIAIQDAEIEFFVANNNLNFFPPPRLGLYQPFSKTSNRNYYIPDVLSSNASDGYYNSTTNSYKFKITRYLQKILNAKFFENRDINNGLFLAVPSDKPVIGARGVIDHSKTKIHIVYSTIN